mgnify:CR=1 FL=1
MCLCFFFQAEDGIRDLVRARGLGDVYKRQPLYAYAMSEPRPVTITSGAVNVLFPAFEVASVLCVFMMLSLLALAPKIFSSACV